MDEGPGAILGFKTFLSFINRLLVTISGEGNGTPTPVLLPGKSHGQRSLTGYSPWGYKESDMTEELTL